MTNQGGNMLNMRKRRPCLCKDGSPCDFHAASCTTCGGGKCKGHPHKYHIALEIRAYLNQGLTLERALIEAGEEDPPE